MNELKAGQIYKWGEMHEDEFGRQTYENWVVQVECVLGGIVTIKKGTHTGNLGPSESMGFANMLHEIGARRMHLIKDVHAPTVPRKSRLEEVDCD